MQLIILNCSIISLTAGATASRGPQMKLVLMNLTEAVGWRELSDEGDPSTKQILSYIDFTNHRYNFSVWERPRRRSWTVTKIKITPFIDLAALRHPYVREGIDVLSIEYADEMTMNNMNQVFSKVVEPPQTRQKPQDHLSRVAVACKPTCHQDIQCY